MEPLTTQMHARSCSDDLTLIHEPIYVIVDNDVTALLGLISSDSESDVELDNYLVQETDSMVRTKQIASKSDKKGQLPSHSSSGQTLTTFTNRRSPRFLDSDSDLERAANMFGVNTH